MVHRIGLDELDLSDRGADAAVFMCVDRGFLKVQRRFLREALGIQRFDTYAYPGGGASLLDKLTFRKKVLSDVRRVSIELHRARMIVAMLHADCMKYGGTATFGSSAAEAARYRRDLEAIRALLTKSFPDTEVVCVYSTVNGHGLEHHVV